MEATNSQILERFRALSADELRAKSKVHRLMLLDLIDTAKLGHYSSSLSAIEILNALYHHVMRLKIGDPEWSERDRFLLGKGHIAVALWPIFAELGFFPGEWLDTFGSFDSKLTDHPDMRRTPGVDFSSGSLGHNLSVGLGMAIAGKKKKADYRVFVLLGDGEMHEGQIWEALMAASHHKVGNLVAIIDANGSCGDGPTTSVMDIEPLAERIGAFGWHCIEMDGHNPEAVLTAFGQLPDASGERPTCVIARTIKGKGVSFMETAPRDWHLGFLGPKDLERARQEISEAE